MAREVWGENGDKVVVVDQRDLLYDEYTVDVLLDDGGYKSVYSSTNLDKCIKKARQLSSGAIWSANGTPISNNISVLDFSK